MLDFEIRDEQSLSKPKGSAHSQIVILGLGNPILGDDGVGWVIAKEVQSRLASQDNHLHEHPLFLVEVDYLSIGGLSLMERLIDYQKAILIDAIVTGSHPTGTIMHCELEDLPAPDLGHLSSSHDVSLQTALEFGRSMGAKLPERIMIVAVEALVNLDFSEELSPPIAAAVPQAAALTIQLLDELMGKS